MHSRHWLTYTLPACSNEMHSDIGPHPWRGMAGRAHGCELFYQISAQVLDKITCQPIEQPFKHQIVTSESFHFSTHFLLSLKFFQTPNKELPSTPRDLPNVL